MTGPACRVPRLGEIAKHVPKILADVGQDAVFEFGIDVRKFAILVAVGIAVRKSSVFKPLHAGWWLWWNFDSKLGFKHFPEVAVPPPLKSSEQNFGVFVIHGLKRLELPKEASYVAISDFIIVPRQCHLGGTQKRFRFELRVASAFVSDSLVIPQVSKQLT